MPGTFRTQIKIPANFLVPGSYLLTVAIVDANMRLIDMHEDTISFEVGETGNTRARRANSNGVVNIDLAWNTEPLTEAV